MFMINKTNHYNQMTEINIYIIIQITGNRLVIFSKHVVPNTKISLADMEMFNGTLTKNTIVSGVKTLT